MDRKVLAILLIFIIGLTIGCAGRKSDGGATPTIAPTPAPTADIASPTAQASATPTIPTITPTPAPATGNSGDLDLDPSLVDLDPSLVDLDPSLVDLSGEGYDEGGFPENGLPTPTLD
jgi:hypothetical protein